MINVTYIHQSEQNVYGEHGAFTVAYYVSVPDGVGLQVAAAFCHPEDHYQRKVGSMLAHAILVMGKPGVQRHYVRTLDLFPLALSRAIMVSDIKPAALTNALVQYVARHQSMFKSDPVSPRPSVTGSADQFRSRKLIVNSCLPPEAQVPGWPIGKEGYPTNQKPPRFLTGKIDLVPTRGLVSEEFEEQYLAPDRSFRSK